MPVKPRIFIASSFEGKSIADALEIALQADGHCTAWHNAFPLSNNTLDTLLKRCAENDFAIFIFSPDDRLSFRAASFEVARDNVLFESGLFMGTHGKERGFIIVPHDNPKFHIPTDFSGFTTASYDHDRARKEARPALGAASALIRESLRNWSRQRLEIRPFAKLEPPPRPGEDPATFELKLRFDIRNPSGFAVAKER
jgi:predicted nucleotide-binding protein